MRTKSFHGNATHTNPGSPLGLPNRGGTGLGKVTTGGPSASRILAPSKTGSTVMSSTYSMWYNLVPSPAITGVKTNRSVTFLRHYKSPTVYSDGVKPTDYTRMIAKLNVNFPYSASNGKYNIESFTGDQRCSLEANPYGSSYANGQTAVPSWMTSLAVLQAVNEMNQVSQNILEDLAQLRQTGVMVADIVKTIFLLYLDARKGLWWKIRRALREKGINIPRHIANGWLMFFYGIKPLVGTIDQICTRERPLRRSYSVRKRVSDGVSLEGFVDPPKVWRSWSGSAKIQAQCGIRAIIDLDGNLRSWTKLGLGLDSFNNLAVTAWALVPYSFVFDWFIPVEAWLRSLAWSPFLKYQGGYTGARHEAKGSYTDTYPFSAPNSYKGKLPKGELVVRNYQRKSFLYSLPSTTLSIRLTLNSTQIISAAALIIK